MAVEEGESEESKFKGRVQLGRVVDFGVIDEAAGQRWRGKQQREKMIESRKIGVGERATGIEHETALKQGAPGVTRHPKTSDRRRIYKLLLCQNLKSALKARINLVN
jgi:hypothetical protein